MKIAILKSRLDKSGGLEKYARHTAAAFAERGHQVTILTTGTPPATPCEVVSLGEDLPFSVSNVFAFDYWCKRWLQDHPQDRVLGMDRNSWQTHYRAGSGSHRAYLERRGHVESLARRLSFKINPLHQLTLRLEKRAFESPDLQTLITNSHLVRNEILERYKIAPEKVRVIHNGVEWAELQTPFDEWQQHHDSNERTVLFVGHGYRRKGLGSLLRALPQDCRLLIVGKDRNPAPFQQLIDQRNLSAQILGPQSPIIPYLQAADILVLPTLYDPCANVTLEALAMGLHVITSSANGASELLTPETGQILPDCSPESIAEALRRAPLKTPESAQKIRDSIHHLNFPNQLDQLVDAVLR